MKIKMLTIYILYFFKLVPEICYHYRLNLESKFRKPLHDSILNLMLFNKLFNQIFRIILILDTYSLKSS